MGPSTRHHRAPPQPPSDLCAVGMLPFLPDSLFSPAPGLVTPFPLHTLPTQSAGQHLTFWVCVHCGALSWPHAGSPSLSQPLCAEPQVLASICLLVALTSASAGSWWSCGFCFSGLGTGPGIGCTL